MSAAVGEHVFGIGLDITSGEIDDGGSGVGLVQPQAAAAQMILLSAARCCSAPILACADSGVKQTVNAHSRHRLTPVVL